MNTLKVEQLRVMKLLATSAIFSVFLVSCVSTPTRPPGADDARAELTQLKSDPNLGSRAPAEIREAEAAVRLAEMPVPKDRALGSHRVQMANYKVAFATAKASTRYLEDQRVRLSEDREHARLLARTREADMARKQADTARLEASHARDDADAARASEASTASHAARQAEIAREEADAARHLAAANANDAAKQKMALQRQIDLLEAKTTDRGLVLTLSNVLFATGKADLKTGATNTLDKLVSFLNQYQDRNVTIEGHTDNVGTSLSNQVLSRDRAESVKSYMLQKGINSQRIAAAGMGENEPVAENESEAGRQQNRRVEIIIDNPPQVASAVTESE